MPTADTAAGSPKEKKTKDKTDSTAQADTFSGQSKQQVETDISEEKRKNGKRQTKPEETTSVSVDEQPQDSKDKKRSEDKQHKKRRSKDKTAANEDLREIPEQKETVAEASSEQAPESKKKDKKKHKQQEKEASKGTSKDTQTALKKDEPSKKEHRAKGSSNNEVPISKQRFAARNNRARFKANRSMPLEICVYPEQRPPRPQAPGMNWMQGYFVPGQQQLLMQQKVVETHVSTIDQDMVVGDIHFASEQQNKSKMDRRHNRQDAVDEKPEVKDRVISIEPLKKTERLVQRREGILYRTQSLHQFGC